jgi:pilus assembly protein Flp/PilA
MTEFGIKTYARAMAFMFGVKDRKDREDRGATAVEYGLMVALIAVVIIAGVQLLGTNLQSRFNQIATTIGAA